MERLDFTPFANAVEAQVSKLFDMAIQKKLYWFVLPCQRMT